MVTNDTNMDILVRKDSPSNPALAALLAEHFIEQRRNVPEGFAYVLDLNGLDNPAITFWSAWERASSGRASIEPIGVGALKELDEETGEIKSMRSAKLHRGKGVGRALLGAIVSEARSRGYRRLYLETGTADVYRPAVALYRRAGFVSCGAFGEYRPSLYNQFFCLDIGAQNEETSSR
ncbi:hypothetical protein VTK56DRAFT_3520 [Thermocarpiscus australiensis]